MNRPWWLWLATASFVAYWFFLNSSFYYVRESAGFSSMTTEHGVIVESVTQGSVAERAGMRAGDRLISAYGLPQEDQLDVMMGPAAMPVDEATEWVVERDGARQTLTFAAMPRKWNWPATSAPYLLVLLAMTVSLALGLVLAWRGDRRPVTLLGAWLLMSMGCATLPLWPRSMAYELRALPLPLILLLWPAALSSLLPPVQMFAFCALVPRPLMRPWTLALALAPLVAVVAYVATTTVLIVHDPLRATSLAAPRWMFSVGPLSYVFYFGSSAVLLLIAHRRASDINDRRRVTILLAGTTAGATGLLLIAGAFAPGRRLTQSVLLAGALLFATLPVAFAYATLRHRLFDLRVIVRLGLQYALARGAIAAAIPVTVLVLIADVMLHRSQSVDSIMRDRGWNYAVVLAVITLIYAQRRQWMAALDKQFFRERYVAQQILKDVVEDIGTATDLQAAAEKVIGRIDSALHPVMAAVMIKLKSATAFSAVAATPGAHTPPLPAGSPITQVVRALGKPVVAATIGLADIGELVVPIAVEPNSDEALLVLGPRRSEEPYSQEDQDLLSAIATSLRLLMGRAPIGEMPTGISTRASSPRLLGNRYRIDRPIGEGGMGVVYAATDETLQRRVAIKLIKDQHLVGDALGRFQREARTAASLSHPNIVTVHDFGTDEAGSPYLVMELLQGRSLRTAIKTEGRMPAARALAIMSGLAAAVDAAHSQSVIHRDLKPENVFLTTDTHAKILDYGIAKIATAPGATGANTTAGVLGTLAYMAPEQASGGKPSPAWDVWSLSVIAFEMLTGQHPFGGGLPVTTATPIRTLTPDIDGTMADALDRALSHRQSDRPATAMELIESFSTH